MRPGRIIMPGLSEIIHSSWLGLPRRYRKLPYERKTASSAFDAGRLQKAEARRRRRELARTGAVESA